jgi:hypothetical protein
MQWWHELAKVFSQMFGRSISVKLDVIGRSQPSVSVSALPSPHVATPSPIPAAVEYPITPPVEPTPTPAPKIEPPPPPIIAEPESLPPVDLFDGDPALDFAEPPDSLDLERAENSQVFKLEYDQDTEAVDIDPLLKSATEHIVKTFDGEIIDRSHDLFDKVVGDS